jgi:hypothetical protein
MLTVMVRLQFQHSMLRMILLADDAGSLWRTIQTALSVSVVPIGTDMLPRHNRHEKAPQEERATKDHGGGW